MSVPYHLEQVEKEQRLLDKVNELTAWHTKQCKEYALMLDKSEQALLAKQMTDVPFLPVQLFKLMDLKSITQEDVWKVLTSSGTTDQRVSKIYLDKETASQQTKTLVEVMKPILGTKRLPMVILDKKSVLKDRQSFSARGAGILGFSNFGRKHFYALHDDMSLDLDGLTAFLKQYEGQRILIFGFTFIIWQYVYKAAREQQLSLDFENCVLIHGGGWKKLKDEAVDAATFNQLLKTHLGIQHIHNYYGMVEQIGSIFTQCKEGYLHAPQFADVIIRHPITFKEVAIGEQGLIQVISELPKSYPGHSLLTEDLGTIHGIDQCKCGWKGKYFTVAGRIAKAELRGCSDTFQGGRDV